jgi:uncharacterized protein (TIGR04255 family)
MAAIRHLSRAPITEALFDFRVTLPQEFQTEAITSVRERLKDKYPVVEDMRRFEAQFEFQPGKLPVPTSGETGGLLGYRFRSDDGRNFAQFRRDGFTYNRLPPYTNWDELCPEALRLWDLYVEVTKPEKLERLAVRYINRLLLPLQFDLADYVEVAPPYFPGAPPFLSSFLIRESRHDPQTGFMVNIVQAIDPTLAVGSSALILDIDVSKIGGLGLREAQIRPVLEQFHDLKNQIFFSAITERTATEYE